MKIKTAKDLLIMLKDLEESGANMEVPLLFDTEGRNYHYHMAEIDAAYLDDGEHTGHHHLALYEGCQSAGHGEDASHEHKEYWHLLNANMGNHKLLPWFTNMIKGNLISFEEVVRMSWNIRNIAQRMKTATEEGTRENMELDEIICDAITIRHKYYKIEKRLTSSSFRDKDKKE